MILKPLRMEIECDTLKLDLIEGHYRPRGGSELIAHLRLVLFHNLNMIMTRRLLLIVGLTVVAFLMVVAFSLLLVLQGLVYFNISACLFLFFSFFFLLSSFSFSLSFSFSFSFCFCRTFDWCRVSTGSSQPHSKCQQVLIKIRCCSLLLQCCLSLSLSFIFSGCCFSVPVPSENESVEPNLF